MEKEFERIKNEIRKDFKKKSVIKRVQKNLDYLKDSEILKPDFSRFYFVNEPSFCYWNSKSIKLSGEDKENILKDIFEETKNLFVY